ncbi:type IV conjugative transfer system pilin TraA [Morganella morganii]|uniref:type IV conjugative transfer system pilin TraA n=1 Tax=Morganella morganii TaxID=582 RepID=UPI001BDA6AB7|nr:type IV conjugative transfer system pilin TraA [Morganella morganii]MBT0513767.1 TraA fimbrial protein precursor [Morganella morganii subsp. morganii]WOZ90376.1 type IV conjugative transfer system pilin TraA [Morganella morganii]
MGTKIISLKTVLRNAFSNKKFITMLGVTSFAAGLMMMPSTHALADDLFAGAKDQVKDSFGKDSAIIYILYVIEVLMAVFTYIKTKNLMMMGGIAAVLIFVNVAFGLF